jgi:SAM-dependent methyltransferase
MLDKFDNEKISKNELKKIFNNYFLIFPKKILNKNSVGIDIGSGSGRWADFVVRKVKKLYLLEPSKKALDVSKKKLKLYKNVSYHNVEIKKINTINSKFDFAYSLGVIHHLNYPLKAFKLIKKKLKENSPFLVYLYHDLEENNLFYKFLWKLSEILRWFISKQNFFIKSIITDLIAILIYFPLSRITNLLLVFFSSPKNFPLSYYMDKPFYVMRNDALDRFGTKYEKRYSRSDIIKLFKKSGFKKIKIAISSQITCISQK